MAALSKLFKRRFSSLLMVSSQNCSKSNPSGRIERSEGFFLLFTLTYKQQMIAHSQELRLLTDVEVVTQVLLIGCMIKAVD